MESCRWKEVLDGNIPFMQQNLLLTEIFYGYLITAKIFSDEIIQEIRNGVETNEARILRLVSFLRRRDYSCFTRFLSILSETHNQHVRERLEMPHFESYQSCDVKTKDLELLVADLQRKLVEADNTAKLERERSKHYLEVIQQLSWIMGQSSKESPTTNDRGEQDAEELVEEIDCLKEQIDRLECKLEHTTQDLQTAKHQLSVALKSEQSIKRGLGLRDDACQDEVNSKIAEIKSNSKELQKYREEMERIGEMKDVYNEKIRKLTLNMSRLESEKRTKDMEIERLLRNKDDDLVLKKARSLLRFRHGVGVVRPEEISLPRITIGSRIPSSKTVRNCRNRSAKEPKMISVEQLNTVAKAEAKYCVLCRKEYYLRDACRFHTASPKDGSYSCCGVRSYGAAASHGCKAIASHLYVDSLGGEIVFYDQRGRRLNFKEIEINKESHLTERLL